MSNFNAAQVGLRFSGDGRDGALDSLMDLAMGGDDKSLTDFQVSALDYSQFQAKAEIVNETARGAVKIVKDTAGWVNR